MLTLYMILTCVFSTWVYFAELGWEYSQLKSIPGTLWWGFVTVITVGYGDIVPVSVVGKVIACLLAITGVFLYSIVAAILVQIFKECKNGVQYKK